MTQTTTADLEALVRAALNVRDNAHAPYSGFSVGAALRSFNGRVFVGVNVENAAFPSGTCAERSALCAAVSAGERRFSDIVIVTDADNPAAPCGTCRQALAEFGLDLDVLLVSVKGVRRGYTLRELLPAAFTPDDFEPRPHKLHK